LYANLVKIAIHKDYTYFLTFAVHYQQKNNIDLKDIKIDGWKIYNFHEEYKRWGIDLADKKCNLRLLNNKNFEICKSYPKELIVPLSITDEEVVECSNFRTKARFPGKIYLLKLFMLFLFCFYVVNFN